MRVRITALTGPPLERIRIGVSSCLLGAAVRYDGQHKRNDFLVDELGPLVEWVPVCPEVEVGMGVPRESVRLARGPRGIPPRVPILMLGNQSGADWTARMEAFAARRVEELAEAELSGYVLKSRSPSCGLEGVPLFPDGDAASRPSNDGVGLFAAELLRRLPNLPIEEEARLADPRLRARFIERVFGYDRWRRR
jgi:uncharacterized protein YbbK (DUF523 family)